MRYWSLALALTALAAGGAGAQDGMPELERVQQTYLGLRSYSQKISTTISNRIAGRSSVAGQTSELRYQQPNHVFIQVSAPNTGTTVTYNGAEMLVYRSKDNVYQKRPAQPTVKAYVKALREFGIGTMLDPLAFLTGEPIRTAVASATIKGSETVEGSACQVIAAKLAASVAGKAKAATATFWVDKSAHILRKVQLSMNGIPATMRVRSTQNGKQVVKSLPVTLDNTIIMSMQDVQVNPPLNEAAFTFNVPAGATLQDPSKMMKK